MLTMYPGLQGFHVNVVIEQVNDLPADAFDHLVAPSKREGWRYVQRLAEEWASGANRFDQLGEVLLVARVEGKIVGVCGLNIDPYTGDPTIGRVRRLYVHPDYRGQGLGRELL